MQTARMGEAQRKSYLGARHSHSSHCRTPHTHQGDGKAAVIT
jgi:hypothetical protein